MDGGIWDRGKLLPISGVERGREGERERERERDAHANGESDSPVRDRKVKGDE